MSPIAKCFTFLFLLLALYCGIDPFHHSSIHGFPNFEAHRAEMPPWNRLPTDRDEANLLQNSEARFLNQVQGPESVAFDPQGRGPYTGVADGRILFWDGANWNNFAFTSPNRSAICDPQPTVLGYVKNEHICGRPLGLRFHKRTGELYIADAYFGLMKVGPEGGLATPLTREAEGVPFGFTNDVEVDENGVVYFTDSSTVYKRRNFLQLVFSCENSGRVMKYDPLTKETTVLLRGLQFPNGISLSKDGTFFVFSDGIRGLLRKHWLEGDKKGTTETMAVLPGYPDNVRRNEEGDFWVALHCRRTVYSHVNGLYPKLRMFLLKLPISAKIHYLVQIGFRVHGIVAKYSPDGRLMKILEDREGKVVRAASEVEEHDGQLWIGSVLMSFIGVYKLD